MSKKPTPVKSNQRLAPPTAPRNIFHGKLNLEQQKKRAKELLKKIRNEDPEAIHRLNQHPRSDQLPDSIQLSHCQLIIARENGFNSWPAMKTHIDSLLLDSRTLDSENTLHIRCGHDIQHGLKLAGFCGEYLAFFDPFCQGPVQDLPLDQLIKLRSKFAADTYSLNIADATTQTKNAYAPLQAYQASPDTQKWQKIILWFEHDSYDQLILAFLLSFFSRHAPNAPLELICVDQIPGVADFIGLGQLSPELFRYLWDNQRSPVTASQLALGETVWQALCDDTPALLQQLTASGTPALPLMTNALLRHLAELPDAQTGLSLTETLALQLLDNTGPITAGKLFGRYMREREPLPWLGDLMFWAILKTLIYAQKPLIKIINENREWPLQEICITDIGQQVLSGKLNYRSLMKSPRWVGGICIQAAAQSDL